MATLMLEGGADIRYIQAMLGHAELSTTQIYTQVSIRTLQAVHAATHPGATNTRHRTVDPDDSTHPDDGIDVDPNVELEGTALSSDRHHDGDGDTAGDGDVSDEAVLGELFASLDQEINQENRADPDHDVPLVGRDDHRLDQRDRQQRRQRRAGLLG